MVNTNMKIVPREVAGITTNYIKARISTTEIQDGELMLLFANQTSVEDEIDHIQCIFSYSNSISISFWIVAFRATAKQISNCKQADSSTKAITLEGEAKTFRQWYRRCSVQNKNLKSFQVAAAPFPVLPPLFFFDMALLYLTGFPKHFDPCAIYLCQVRTPSIWAFSIAL